MTENNDGRMIFVRAVIWFGIVEDFFSVVQYVFPEFMLKSFGIDTPITPVMRLLLIQAAALMGAWTLLLGWADQKPIQRRVVLLLTVPIALGMCYSFGYLIAVGVLARIWILFLLAPTLTAGLFLAAYLIACKIKAMDIKKESNKR
jgi:hypothetical protein